MTTLFYVLTTWLTVENGKTSTFPTAKSTIVAVAYTPVSTYTAGPLASQTQFVSTSETLATAFPTPNRGTTVSSTELIPKTLRGNLSLGLTTVPSGEVSPSGTSTTASTFPSGTTANTSGTGSETTITSSRSPAPTDTTNPGPQIISPGAAAGIAIGCILAGLVLGLLAAFFIYRRRSAHHHGSTVPQASYVVESKGSTGFSPASSSHPPPHPPPPRDDLQLSQFLLDGTPDKELAGEMASLSQLIQHHVESHYHSQPVQYDHATLIHALANLGFPDNKTAGGMSADGIVALAIDPRTRHTALRHVISYVCFTSIDFGSRSRLSMLPAPIAAFLQSVPPVENYGGNEQGKTCLQPQQIGRS